MNNFEDMTWQNKILEKMQINSLRNHNKLEEYIKNNKIKKKN